MMKDYAEYHDPTVISFGAVCNSCLLWLQLSVGKMGEDHSVGRQKEEQPCGTSKGALSFAGQNPPPGQPLSHHSMSSTESLRQTQQTYMRTPNCATFVTVVRQW